jgi:hypothetical protein
VKLWALPAILSSFLIAAQAQADDPYLYRVLGIHQDATPEQIQAAHQRAVDQQMEIGLDWAYSNSEGPLLKLDEIDKAYFVLRNPRRRRAYDLGNDPFLDKPSLKAPEPRRMTENPIYAPDPKHPLQNMSPRDAVSGLRTGATTRFQVMNTIQQQRLLSTQWKRVLGAALMDGYFHEWDCCKSNTKLRDLFHPELSLVWNDPNGLLEALPLYSKRSSAKSFILARLLELPLTDAQKKSIAHSELTILSLKEPVVARDPARAGQADLALQVLNHIGYADTGTIEASIALMSPSQARPITPISKLKNDLAKPESTSRRSDPQNSIAPALDHLAEAAHQGKLSGLLAEAAVDTALRQKEPWLALKFAIATKDKPWGRKLLLKIADRNQGYNPVGGPDFEAAHVIRDEQRSVRVRALAALDETLRPGERDPEIERFLSTFLKPTEPTKVPGANVEVFGGTEATRARAQSALVGHSHPASDWAARPEVPARRAYDLLVAAPHLALAYLNEFPELIPSETTARHVLELVFYPGRDRNRLMPKIQKQAPLIPEAPLANPDLTPLAHQIVTRYFKGDSWVHDPNWSRWENADAMLGLAKHYGFQDPRLMTVALQAHAESARAGRDTQGKWIGKRGEILLHFTAESYLTRFFPDHPEVRAIAPAAQPTCGVSDVKRIVRHALEEE